MKKTITLITFCFAIVSLYAQTNIPLTNQDCDSEGTLTGVSPFTDVPGFIVTETTGAVTINPGTSGVIGGEFDVDISVSTASQTDLLFDTDRVDISSFATNEVFTFIWQMKTSIQTAKTAPYNIVAKFYDEDDLDVTGDATFSIVKTKGNYKTGDAGVYQENSVVVTLQPNATGKNAKFIALQVQLGKLFEAANTGIVTLDSFSLDAAGSALSVDSFKNDFTFTAYPNPTKDNLFFNVGEGIDEISVYSVLGNLVQNVKVGSTQHTLDMSALNKGLYFIKIKNDTGIASKKIIKD